ncbi:hypothetical protein ACQ4PT_004629 [Festuca glaucescens]
MAAPVAISSKDVEAFLASCAASSEAAYGATEAVLRRLQDPASRAGARRLLGAVRRHFADGQEDECARTFHFRIRDVLLDPHLQGSQQRKKLTVMEIPSIFISEDWCFAFYEGLNQLPDHVFRDKTVADLECGNGWISIALAEKWSPLKVYGLDIDPRVIKIAWINLYLNALDDNGLPIYDGEGKTLLDRVEFHESDLLAYCRDNKTELDCIVGCIPQILNPNPEAMSNIITEKSSVEFLYSLNNYYDLQNVVVFPSHDVAIEYSLRLFSPALAIVDEHLTRYLPKQWLTSSAIEGRADCNHAEDAVTVIEAPAQSDLLIELVRKLKP